MRFIWENNVQNFTGFMCWTHAMKGSECSVHIWLWVCEVGEGSQSQWHGRVGVPVPLGRRDVRRWRQDALSYTRRLQQRPQLLSSRYYRNQVFFIRTPGHWPASGHRPQLREEQRHPETESHTWTPYMTRACWGKTMCMLGCQSPRDEVVWPWR